MQQTAVAVVVAEDHVHRPGCKLLAQPVEHKRRAEVAQVQEQFGAGFVGLPESLLQPGDVVMAVREDCDLHGLISLFSNPV